MYGLPDLPVDLSKLLAEIEDEYITNALKATGGLRGAAAKLLGLKRTTLLERLRRRAAGKVRYL